MSLHTQDNILYGLMSFGPDCWYEQAGKLIPEMFDGERRQIFSTIAAKRKTGDLVDLVVVLESCELTEMLHHYASQLIVSRAGMNGYVKDLQKSYATGKARDIGADLMESGDIETAKGAIMALDTSAGSAAISGSQAKKLLIDELTRKAESNYHGIDTGLADLDAVIGGLEPADMCVIASRPSMGKTALALNIIQHQKFPVGKFSLEMSTGQLTLRMTAANGMDYGRLRHPRNMTSDEWKQVAVASGKIRDDLWINDTGGLPIGQLESEAYRMVYSRGVRLIVIDYIQLVTCKSESRLQEVSEVSRRIKAMAKNLKVPVIALCQLNRSIEGRGSPRPRLSDLRETGQLEQDADQIIFIDRPEVHMPGTRTGEADLYVAKNRAGELRDITVSWQGRFQRFGNFTPSLYPRSVA